MNTSHFTMHKYLNLLKIALSPKEIKQKYIQGCNDNLKCLLELYKQHIE